MTRHLDDLILDALEQKNLSAAQILVARAGRLQFLKCYGEAGEKSFFDLASLTKPLATAMVAMQAMQKKLVSPNDPVEKFFETENLAGVALAELLNHRSSLIAWRAFYPQSGVDSKTDFTVNRQKVMRSILHDNKCVVPANRGTVVYSDLGYILLAAILEKVCQKKIDDVFHQWIARPLGLAKQIFFLPRGQKLPFVRSRFVPTQDCPVRKRLAQGEVMDLNCYFLGGVSGHAGLFANAKAIHRILQELRRARLGTSGLIAKKTFDVFCQPSAQLSKRYFTLGFDTPTQPGSLTGKMFSKNTIGHWGYSGTGVWWDLERDIWIISLSNQYRFHHDGTRAAMLRPQLHDVLLEKFA